MDRRHALAGFAGSAAGIWLGIRNAGADEVRPAIPGAIKIELNQPTKINQRSAPVTVEGNEHRIVSLGTGVFHLDGESRLTAALKAAVLQKAELDYWISVAVFDRAGRLLGTAQHHEPVKSIRIPLTPTVFREIEFDFGISTAFRTAAYVVVSISEPDAPQ
jgi:hypothetical protein